jgi:hypothetical protein
MAKTLEDYRQESLAKLKRQKSMDSASNRLTASRAARNTTGVSGTVDRRTPMERLKAGNKGKTVEGSLAALKSPKPTPATAPKSSLDRMKERNKGKTVEGSLATIKGDPTKARIAALGKGLAGMKDSAPAKAAAPAKPSAPAGAVKTVSTKGGNYPVYKKGSAEAKSFGAAFNEARDKGLKVFPWQGRSYSTKKKGE